MSLHHYTCDDRAELIRAEGLVIPNPLFWWREVALSWWTDLDKPDRYALGLTSVLSPCDRTAHRFTAKDPSSIIPWTQWARQNAVPRLIRDVLEIGSAPAHWYVSERPVAVKDAPA